MQLADFQLGLDAGHVKEGAADVVVRAGQVLADRAEAAGEGALGVPGGGVRARALHADAVLQPAYQWPNIHLALVACKRRPLSPWEEVLVILYLAGVIVMVAMV